MSEHSLLPTRQRAVNIALTAQGLVSCAYNESPIIFVATVFPLIVPFD